MLDRHAFPRTDALRRALERAKDRLIAQDLLFLEAWEVQPTLTIADTLRVHQLRRANPALANAIRDEVRCGKIPLRRKAQLRKPA